MAGIERAEGCAVRTLTPTGVTSTFILTSPLIWQNCSDIENESGKSVKRNSCKRALESL
jgi:hypothetical protein